jgi:hypothetical protein
MTNTVSTGSSLPLSRPVVGAAGRVRTGDLHHGKVTRYLLRYNRARASGGIRTRSLVRTKDALHLVSFEGMVPRAGVEPALTGF